MPQIGHYSLPTFQRLFFVLRNLAIPFTMAAQSKISIFLPNQRLKSLISELSLFYLRHRNKISRTLYLTLLIALLNRIHSAIIEQKAAALSQVSLRRNSISQANGEHKKKPEVELNRVFFRNLFRLLRVCIPGWRSEEMKLLVNQSILLVIRTLISLKVAAMDGALVSSLIRGKGKDFTMGILWWMLIAVPATVTNSMASNFQIQARLYLLIYYSSPTINASSLCSTGLG